MHDNFPKNIFPNYFFEGGGLERAPCSPVSYASELYCTDLKAATAAGAASRTDAVSLPPNPPPLSASATTKRWNERDIKWKTHF